MRDLSHNHFYTIATLWLNALDHVQCYSVCKFVYEIIVVIILVAVFIGCIVGWEEGNVICVVYHVCTVYLTWSWYNHRPVRKWIRKSVLKADSSHQMFSVCVKCLLKLQWVTVMINWTGSGLSLWGQTRLLFWSLGSARFEVDWKELSAALLRVWLHIQTGAPWMDRSFNELTLMSPLRGLVNGFLSITFEED